MIDELISAILQILAFTLIPWIVYLIMKKRLRGFFSFIGFTRSNTKANLLALLVSVTMFLPLFVMILLNDEFLEIMHDPSSMTGKFKAIGVSFSSVSLIVVAAVFKTALSEEILFRGFVAKRLIAATNFRTGNLIQAIIFGLIHSLLFLTISKDPLFLVTIFIFPALGGYLMVHINEKIANGSIIPGWIAHASSNLMSYFIIGLLL